MRWFRTPDTSYAQIFSVAVDPNGGVYIAGYSNNNLAFGAANIQGAYNFGFLARFDSNGNCTWLKRLGGQPPNSPTTIVTAGLDLAVRPSGNVVVCGVYFGGGINLGDVSLAGSSSSSSHFVAEINNEREVLWVKGFSTPSDESSYAVPQGYSWSKIRTDTLGNVYFAMRTGTYSNPTSVLHKFSPNGGVLWSKALGIDVFALELDMLNRVYVAGGFSGKFTSGAVTVSSAGKTDGIIVQFDGTGQAVWGKASGSFGLDSWSAMIPDQAGNLILAGSFEERIRLDSINLSIDTSFTSPFLAQLGTNNVPLYPVIQAQPQSMAVNPGATAIFVATASGAPPLTYQWRLNGTPIASATNAVLQIPGVQLANAGLYDLVVSNAVGSADSETVALTVQPGFPAFADAFEDRGIMVGFTNFVLGNSSLYSAEPAEPAHGGRKGNHSAWLTWTAPDNGTCVLNTFGSGFDTVIGVYTGTNLATLTPVASNDDADESVQQSQVVFNAIAGVGYQIAVDGYSPLDAGNIVFQLSFSNAVPIIAVSPNSQRVLAGSPVVLAVSAVGVPPLRYQWRFNDVDLLGATLDSYGILSASPENAGRYSVVVANDFGSVTSAVATVTIDTKPDITRSPASQIVIADDPVTLSVEATGTEPLSYQWRFNQTNLIGAFGPQISIERFQPNQAGRYTVVVSNPYASVTSSVATLEANYAIRLATNGVGRIEVNPSQTGYAAGAVVDLLAVPGPGAFFAGWTGELQTTNNPLRLTITRNISIAASFATAGLSLSVAGQGAIRVEPDQPFYGLGEVVDLYAVAGRWHVFESWNDGSTENPRSVVIARTNEFSARFSPTEPLETLEHSGQTRTAPVGMPAFFVDGHFIAQSSVTNLDAVTVEITSTIPGSTILYTLDGSIPGLGAILYTKPVHIPSAATVRAVAYASNFDRSVESDPLTLEFLPAHRLVVMESGGGLVNRTPEAIQYAEGTPVALEAVPSPGWQFQQWSGDVVGTNPLASLVMTQDRLVQPSFVTSLRSSAIGGGAVLASPDTAVYRYGSTVTLTAIPDPGRYFAFWAGTLTETVNPLALEVTSAQPNVVAVFQPLAANEVSLTVLSEGLGSVRVQPEGNRFRANQRVTLTATPAANQVFEGWSTDGVGALNPLPLSLDRSQQITARFSARSQLRLSLSGSENSPRQLRLWISGGRDNQVFEIQNAEQLEGPWQSQVILTNQLGSAPFLLNPGPSSGVRWYRAIGR